MYPKLGPSGTAFGNTDILHKVSQDLLNHALTLLAGFGDLVGDGLGHALIIKLVCVGHLGHGRGGVDVGTISSDGVDGWLHDL